MNLIVKLASKYMERKANRAYDVMMRLQFLEGALGKPAGHWSFRANAGLLNEARQQSLSEGHTIHPDWFMSTDTGMFTFVLRNLGSMLNRAKMYNKTRTDSTQALDMLNSALMGLGILGEGKSSPLVYEVGKIAAPKVLKGKETPQSEAPVVFHFFSGKVLNLIKAKKNQSMDEEEGKNVVLQEREPVEVLSEILRDRTDPLGRKLRELILSAVPSDSKPGELIAAWVSKLESTGRFPNKGMLASELGITSVDFSKTWKLAWHQIFKTIWKTPSIQRALEDRYNEAGVDYEISKPQDFEIAWNKSKLASVLANKWMSQR
jgi:hypothetical protein